jgi:hypothetical protein
MCETPATTKEDGLARSRLIFAQLGHRFIKPLARRHRKRVISEWWRLKAVYLSVLLRHHHTAPQTIHVNRVASLLCSLTIIYAAHISGTAAVGISKLTFVPFHVIIQGVWRIEVCKHQ